VPIDIARHHRPSSSTTWSPGVWCGPTSAAVRPVPGRCRPRR